VAKKRNKRENAAYQALYSSYTARAILFYREVLQHQPDTLVCRIRELDASQVHWETEKLNIQQEALRALDRLKIPYHHIFAHPQLLSDKPDLIDYYRNISAVSKKGLAQLLAGVEKLHRLELACKILNGIMSRILLSQKCFTFQLAQNVMIAEIGSELQGKWVNIVGAGAARTVKDMILAYAQERGYLKQPSRKDQITLKNGYKIVFASEPDVEIRDESGKLQCVIEIKGSMDKAGAQTRYGEAKKSFTKALRENPKCETIYLASCFTDAVRKQIASNGQVRKSFSLPDILTDEGEKQKFLSEIFKYIIRIE